MKIRPEGAEFFHADRQTDITKLLVAFRKFENSPKNETKRRTITCFQEQLLEANVTLAVFLHPPFCQHGGSRLPPNGFSCNFFIWGLLPKFIYTFQIFFENKISYVKFYICFSNSLAVCDVSRRNSL